MDREDGALFAYIAGRLEGRRSGEALGEVAQDVGLSVGGETVRKSPARSSRAKAASREIVTDTVDVHLDAIDFFEAVVELRPDGDPGTAADVLADRIGVTRIVRKQESGNLLAFIVYETRADQLALEAGIAEVGEIQQWASVDLHSGEAAKQTWRGLARRAAAMP